MGILVPPLESRELELGVEGCFSGLWPRGHRPALGGKPGEHMDRAWRWEHGNLSKNVNQTGVGMRRAVAALEYASRNDLAWLILRVTQKLSPCSKTSLIAYISGDYPTSPTTEIIFDALLRLEAPALIQIANEQIAITEKGRRFLDELAVDHLSPRTPFDFLTAPTLLIGSRATTLIRRLRALLWNAAKASGATLAGLPFGRSRLILFGGALLVVATATAGALALLSTKRAESSRGETVALNTTVVSGSPAVAEEPDALGPKINRREAVRIAVQEQLAKLTSISETPRREQEALVEYYSVPAQPLLWVDENGLTNRATAVMQEIAKADDYGLRSIDYRITRTKRLQYRRQRRCGLARRRGNQNRFCIPPLRARRGWRESSILHA